VLHQATKDGYRVTQILLTHNHFDHTEGVDRVLQETTAKIHLHEDDQAPLVHNGVPVVAHKNGDRIALGKLMIQVLSTPGHTPGSVCFLVQDPLTSLSHLF
jgi:glyoxylase-like metal-dependent hydrolase (beta-lactamase superfamily II)